jgi:hypothetical protein
MADWWQPLVGVGLGWVLGQSSDWWRQRRRARQYRRAIYVELRDVHSTLKTRILILKVMLQKCLDEGSIEDYPSDIVYPIFKAHFSEVSLQFSESERLGLVHIYSLIDALNANFSLIRSNWDTLSSDEKLSRDNLRKAIKITQGSYISGREIDVMIGFLLQDRHKYDIRDAKRAEILSGILDAVKEELRGLRPATSTDDPPHGPNDTTRRAS